MSTLTWNWTDFWEWFTCIEDVNHKVDILKQLDANFVKGMSWEVQVELFLPAPLEIVENIKSILKPQAFEFIIKERHKQMKKTRRK